MLALDADTGYREMLEAAGVTMSPVDDRIFAGDGCDAHLAWAAFKTFAGVPVESEFVDAYGERNLLQADLVQCSLDEGARWPVDRRGETAPTVCRLSFTRLLGFGDADGEYVQVVSLVVSIEFAGSCPEGKLTLPARAGLAGDPELSGPTWWHGEDPARSAIPLIEWIAEVERSDGFRATMGTRTPSRFIFLLQTEG